MYKFKIVTIRNVKCKEMSKATHTQHGKAEEEKREREIKKIACAVKLNLTSAKYLIFRVALTFFFVRFNYELSMQFDWLSTTPGAGFVSFSHSRIHAEIEWWENYSVETLDNENSSVDNCGCALEWHANERTILPAQHHSHLWQIQKRETNAPYTHKKKTPKRVC